MFIGSGGVWVDSGIDGVSIIGSGIVELRSGSDSFEDSVILSYWDSAELSMGVVLVSVAYTDKDEIDNARVKNKVRSVFFIISPLRL